MTGKSYLSKRGAPSDWLPKVPNHWQIKPLWTLFSRQKRTGHVAEKLLSVYRDYGVIEKATRDDNFNKPSEDLSAYQLVECHDLTINKMKSWQGSVGVAELRGIVSPAYFVYVHSHNENSRYLHYLFRSKHYIIGYLANSKGIRVNQWDLDPQQHSRMPVLLPPGPEQNIIAAFLDHETAKIDALVAEQKRLIELLKEKRQAVISHAVTKGLDPNVPMKNSGVAWIGYVPAHWSVGSLRWYSEIQGGIAKGKDHSGKDVIQMPYLRVANVQNGHIDLSDVAEIAVLPNDLGRYALQDSDVLMNEGGDNDKLGRGAVWHAEIDPCLHQNHVFAIRPGVHLHAEWLALFTSSESARSYFYLYSKQSTNLASISSRAC